MNDDDFLGLVEDVIEGVCRELDAEVGARLENVEISVETWPTEEVLDAVGVAEGGTLYGLYQGVPRTERSFFQATAFPDRITLYRGPIELEAADPAALRGIVRNTVIHEIAHHFGISDERLIELGAY
jgi:predicted Zn-dependent protease with MMP-like domain